MDNMESRINQHILNHLTGDRTVRDAARNACWEAVHEARQKGWSAELIAKLMDDYIRAGVAMLEAQMAAELAAIDGMKDESPMPWRPMGPPPVWEM